jgi:ABC-type polysaccharide/polyol phosphate export permease
VTATVAGGALTEPGGRGGLLEVSRHRYLLRLLVRKEVRVRYQGSLFGFAWSYVKPTVRFCVYFFVLGVILGLRKDVPNFPIHIFAGMVLIHFFNETFSSATRSVVRNKALVRKIYLPREMFPVASLLVSAVNFVPPFTVLVIGAFVTGWSPSLTGLVTGLLALAIIAVFAMAVGLLFSALNVYFRDFQNVVEVTSLLIFWSTPMIYPWSRVADHFGGTWVETIYLANPLASAVMLFQRTWWIPTISDDETAAAARNLAPNLVERGLVILAAVCLLLLAAQWVFSRLESRFAEEL